MLSRVGGGGVWRRKRKIRTDKFSNLNIYFFFFNFLLTSLNQECNSKYQRHVEIFQPGIPHYRLISLLIWGDKFDFFETIISGFLQSHRLLKTVLSLLDFLPSLLYFFIFHYFWLWKSIRWQVKVKPNSFLRFTIHFIPNHNILVLTAAGSLIIISFIISCEACFFKGLIVQLFIALADDGINEWQKSLIFASFFFVKTSICRTENHC